MRSRCAHPLLGVAAIALMLAVRPARAGDADASVARQWLDLTLESIRADFGRPTVQARNLFHISVAMWDAWATFDERAQPWLFGERHTATDIASARDVAISHAAYRVMLNRFSSAPGFASVQPRYVALMQSLGCNPADANVFGNSPAAIGNRIAQSVIAFGMADGSNQANDYANLIYTPVNAPLIVAIPGNPWAIDITRYQPLALQVFVDQNGNPIPGGFPPFLSAEWGWVTPFSLTPDERTFHPRGGVQWPVYHDPGAPPALGSTGSSDALWRAGHEMVAVWSSHLDPADGVMWDISPASLGNIEPPEGDGAGYYRYYQGGNMGSGYSLNPVTGAPYEPQWVPRGDYARVLAEYWADGPDSETPPGHWFSILHAVMDHPQFNRRAGGQGTELDPLEYDVKAYLALGGAMHDTAISTWSAKGWYDTSRPVSTIRWMCGNGQRSDPSLPSFHPDGVTLHPGYIEVITAATTAPGGQHAELKGYEGLIAIKAWRGPNAITDPATQVAGVGWVLGIDWWPYQRPTFVSPPFGGYTSGHSAFSRAAARVLELMTGSRYFPGGLGEFHVPASQYLVFEDGPSVDFTLQFATFADAADQSALSRIWGGIHPPFDDLPSRRTGDAVGPAAFARARALWGEVACASDLSGDGEVDGTDLAMLLAQWDTAGSADIDGTGVVDGADLAFLLAAWGPCP
jgi:hypothetical protein